MLHGWGLNSGVWEPVSQLIERHFRVTFIDLPGFGRNAQNLPDQYDLASVSMMVAEVMPDKCSLLGWSLGGLVAQQLALTHNGIDKLILVASSPKFAMADDWPGIKPAVLNLFEQQLEQDFSKTLDRFMAIQALGSPSAKRDIKQIKHHIEQYPMPDINALRAGLGLLMNTDLRSVIGLLKMPTYRLYGRLDSLVPATVADHVTRLQPETRSKILAHASHAPFISHPQEFVAYLLTILAD